jgi:tetratricopeptide (TPR) repeat protein
VYVACAIVLLGIVGKGGWDYLADEKEAAVGNDYAASTTPDQLRTFAAEHSVSPLAGAADLQLADQAYAAGKAAEAADDYQKALAALPPGPFVARAHLGLAMAQVQAGRTSEGESGLRQLVNDPTQLKAVRAEATYQLASLAAAAGRPDEVRKLSEQIMQLDPSSPWTQRAFGLQARLTAPAAPASPAPMVAKPVAPAAAH